MMSDTSTEENEELVEAMKQGIKEESTSPNDIPNMNSDTPSPIEYCEGQIYIY
jgi:hypothetical protein